MYGITESDFVYFDPPYYKLGGYSDFNRYTSKQFREKDHFRLAALCRELDANGDQDGLLAIATRNLLRICFQDFKFIKFQREERLI